MKNKENDNAILAYEYRVEKTIKDEHVPWFYFKLIVITTVIIYPITFLLGH